MEEEKAKKEERALENDLDKTFRPNDPSMDLFDYPHDPSIADPTPCRQASFYASELAAVVVAFLDRFPAILNF